MTEPPGEHFDAVVIGLGALGSATAMHLARRGKRVLGLEQFELGHRRGASHDTSRILRHSYHTPACVRLTQQAYADWADLERESGRRLVTVVGGLDLFPPDPAISPAPYLSSLEEVGIAHDVVPTDRLRRRWPQFQVPDGTMGLYQSRGAIVPAAEGTRVMQHQARTHGAELRERTRVLGLEAQGSGGIRVRTDGGTMACRGVVVCADAWTAGLLADLDVDLPLEVTLEQVTYFAPGRAADFTAPRMPLWIWMDDPSFYGFPTYGEETVKA